MYCIAMLAKEFYIEVISKAKFIPKHIVAEAIHHIIYDNFSYKKATNFMFRRNREECDKEIKAMLEKKAKLKKERKKQCEKKT